MNSLPQQAVGLLIGAGPDPYRPDPRFRFAAAPGSGSSPAAFLVVDYIQVIND